MCTHGLWPRGSHCCSPDPLAGMRICAASRLRWLTACKVKTQSGAGAAKKEEHELMRHQ